MYCHRKNKGCEHSSHWSGERQGERGLVAGQQGALLSTRFARQRPVSGARSCGRVWAKRGQQGRSRIGNRTRGVCVWGGNSCIILLSLKHFAKGEERALCTPRRGKTHIPGKRGTTGSGGRTEGGRTQNGPHAGRARHPVIFHQSVQGWAPAAGGGCGCWWYAHDAPRTHSCWLCMASCTAQAMAAQSRSQGMGEIGRAHV